MYGPTKRVVLSTRGIVSIKGKKGVHPLGFWRVRDGLYYVDLKSSSQWYQLVNWNTIANKNLGGFATKDAVRSFVMAYWMDIEGPRHAAVSA